VTACYLAFAAFAAALGRFSGQPIERCWGDWAAAGYTAAAVIIAVARRQRPWQERRRPGRTPAVMIAAAHAIAVACAVAAPLAWQAWAGLPSRAGEGSLTVVANAGSQLLRHGTPYLPAASLSHVLAYDPYEPLMAVFGLPAAAGGALAGWAGDPRLWLALAGTAVCYLAFRVPHAQTRPRAGGDARRRALRDTAFALASPVISLQVATGGTDVPVSALLCLSLALAGNAPRKAAVTTGIACALKATAWPAIPVLAALLAARETPRQAARFAAIATLTAAGAMAASAPAALRAPGAALQNAVLFPLGLARHRTPAASPLPGHLLATAGPAARWGAFALLATAMLTFGWWLAVRPPRDTRTAAVRLAAALAALFTLAPASRWGYYAYPLALLGWCALTGTRRAGPYSSERTVLTPAESASAPSGPAVSPSSSSASSSASSSGADA